MDDKVQQSINILWQYMQLNQPVAPADVLILLGSRDDRVASYAADLLKNNIAPICVVTGNGSHGRNPHAGMWIENNEADHFIAVLQAAGADSVHIYKEDQATNTGENAVLSYTVLANENIQPKSILIITKPYMERRALATFEVQWPGPFVTMHVSSVGGTIDMYCDEQQPFDSVVNVMVGDFQRIVEYPKQGFSAEQFIPANVTEAFMVLRRAGYTNHLL